MGKKNMIVVMTWKMEVKTRIPKHSLYKSEKKKHDPKQQKKESKIAELKKSLVLIPITQNHSNKKKKYIYI